MGTEALICICERIPALLKSNKDYLTKLLEMIFFHMIDLDEEIDDTWMTPIEGFNEDIEVTFIKIHFLGEFIHFSI